MATTAALQHFEERLMTIDPIKFESFADDSCFGHGAEDWLKAELESLDAVHIELTQSGDRIEVKAEMPGFAEKEVEVSVEPRRLTIAGKRGSNTEEKQGNAVNQLQSDLSGRGPAGGG